MVAQIHLVRWITHITGFAASIFFLLIALVVVWRRRLVTLLAVSHFSSFVRHELSVSGLNAFRRCRAAWVGGVDTPSASRGDSEANRRALLPHRETIRGPFLLDRRALLPNGRLERLTGWLLCLPRGSTQASPLWSLRRGLTVHTHMWWRGRLSPCVVRLERDAPGRARLLRLAFALFRSHRCGEGRYFRSAFAVDATVGGAATASLLNRRFDCSDGIAVTDQGRRGQGRTSRPSWVSFLGLPHRRAAWLLGDLCR